MSDTVGFRNYNIEITDQPRCLKDASLGLMTGRRLGSGVYRDTYAMAFSDRHVIKLEVTVGSFCNVNEWQTWKEVAYMDVSKWFAPCVDISRDGGVLVMMRTTPVPDKVWSKVKEVPWFFSDLKQSNFGMLKGRLVCHDYGWTKSPGQGFASKRMRKV